MDGIVANWGAQNDTMPTVLVFDYNSPKPLLEYTTPGSMFDIDLTPSPKGLLVRRLHRHRCFCFVGKCWSLTPVLCCECRGR